MLAAVAYHESGSSTAKAGAGDGHTNPVKALEDARIDGKGLRSVSTHRLLGALPPLTQYPIPKGVKNLHTPPPGVDDVIYALLALSAGTGKKPSSPSS